MPSRFIVVPEWQGSSSSRSMRLIDGAEAIRGDLPSSATTTVEVPLGAGESLGTEVARYSSLTAVRERVADALRAVPADHVPLVIGGDCGVELAAVEHALRAAPDLAVVWLDAHADLNLPGASPSGAFHGMVARALLGQGAEGLVADPALDPGRLVLAGVRACDPPEDAFIAEAGVPMVSPAALEDPAALVAAVEATGATAVYVHVDLDVLDPEDIVGVAAPEPFGVRVPALTAAIRALRERFPLVGAGITEFAPASPADARTDLPAVLRVLSALTARVG
ncbi:arginase family protein [Amnibacterium endophyticum]|uniref:Arginase family protein n=1 Tax=Amnibacterium endophyticum TaxID=2109337 RepID=A0ABW4LDU3_9MICO